MTPERKIMAGARIVKNQVMGQIEFRALGRCFRCGTLRCNRLSHNRPQIQTAARTSPSHPRPPKGDHTRAGNSWAAHAAALNTAAAGLRARTIVQDRGPIPTPRDHQDCAGRAGCSFPRWTRRPLLWRVEAMPARAVRRPRCGRGRFMNEKPALPFFTTADKQYSPGIPRLLAGAA